MKHSIKLLGQGECSSYGHLMKVDLWLKKLCRGILLTSSVFKMADVQ
ncbi:hypothetical protein SAMN05660236_4590 [Ohtaekwangia koreensis]|uniref:Uncharacterized protein n=1 Tax=Ohtaekwangia koreensis TaxID=688867 RepID=A0A1T5M6R4_9BACT|nr:hypothetical protein SAMN05660236_4590 [Ohtaekwangia koreensis]